MKRLEALKKKNFCAEVVVFSTLLFILMITFTISIMDATSLEMAKSYRRADMNRATECMFAEFQKELLDHYDLFALDGSYETGQYSVNHLEKRLEYYGVSGTKNSIKRIQFLTDEDCRPFVEQAVYAAKEKYGLGVLGESSQDSWRKEEENSDLFQKNESQLFEKMDEMLSNEETELTDVGNPISHIAGLKAHPILELVMPKDKKVSEKAVTRSTLLCERKVNRGKGDFSEESMKIGKTETLLFEQYLSDHYACFTEKDHGDQRIAEDQVTKQPLDYELEYILFGKEQDRENLNQTVKKLVKLRMVPNFTYLQTDAEKKAEAEAMAATLSTLVLSPELTEIVAQGILLAWAYGEAIMDVRSLLKGHRVPAIKTAASWQLSLSGLLKLGTEEDQNDGKHTAGGMNYKDYLKVLLVLNSVETNAKRGLTITELDMQKEYACTWFHADQCIEKIEFQSTSSFRRGIRYKYKTYFAYQ
ncbi:MAG: DUF5702 domain-containing protein [Dorea sp.]|nr:DUF5702 domain-containing protein [Dorea sp.]